MGKFEYLWDMNCFAYSMTLTTSGSDFYSLVARADPTHSVFHINQDVYKVDWRGKREKIKGLLGCAHFIGMPEIII
ncbi:hypothetical protein KKA03_01655 [archaeon]|nr:hypothetical protein [archaeon]